MKKTLILFFITLLFITPGCLGGDEKETEQPFPYEANSYQQEEFSLTPPLDSQKKEWETLTTFTKEYPTGTVVAYRDNVKNEDFIANISIYKKSVPSEYSSIDLALEEIRTHEKNVLNYRQLARENIKMTVSGQSVDTLLIYFEGKERHEDEVVKFMQVFGVKNGTGYIVTGASSTEETDTNLEKIETALRSFVIK